MPARRKPDGTARDKTICFKVSPAEWYQVKAAAARRVRPIGTYCRDVMLAASAIQKAAKPPSRPTEPIPGKDAVSTMPAAQNTEPLPFAYVTEDHGYDPGRLEAYRLAMESGEKVRCPKCGKLSAAKVAAVVGPDVTFRICCGGES